MFEILLNTVVHVWFSWNGEGNCAIIFIVDCCCSGDMVTIAAIVKATGSDEGHGGHSSKDRCTFLLYLHAISVSNDKLLAGGDSSPATVLVEFSTKVKS